MAYKLKKRNGPSSFGGDATDVLDFLKGSCLMN